jgi:iron complex transport system permease protein
MMLLVYTNGAMAFSMLRERYILCYGFGAAILVFVTLAGRRLSGKGRPFDIVTMLLIGSIFSQLIGFVVSYVTLYLMDPDMYEIYFNISQALVVDTSFLSWTALGVASAASAIPVFVLRFRLNALAFTEEEVRLFGVNFTTLRAAALICGAIMILAAQVHVGMVGMISLIVPFLSRSVFGCEFRKQLVGNLCIGPILLLACRDVADLIPFVGDGIAVGSAVSVVALPVFMVIMAKQMRGWG